MKTAKLTKTEDLICRYKVKGLKRKKIAVAIRRSENTLLTHNKRIHSKLHVSNDAEVVVWYIENVLKIEVLKFVQVAIILAFIIPSTLLNFSSVD